MKKLSTYFIAAVFFVSFYPMECAWPNPSEDGDDEYATMTDQQSSQTTIDDVNFIKS